MSHRHIGIAHSMSNYTAAKCSEYYGHACPPLPQLMAYSYGPHSRGLHSCGLHRTAATPVGRTHYSWNMYLWPMVMAYIVMGYSEPQPRLSAALTTYGIYSDGRT